MTLDIGYKFKDKALLSKALTHSSAGKKASDNNERFEFLGDRILNFLVAEMLIDQFPREREGDLARRLTNLVCAPTLAEVASAIGLPDFIRLSPAEAASGGAEKMNIQADACEALIAAIYLDGGMDEARTFITKYFFDRMTSDHKPVQDPKSALQEWAQSCGLPLPQYDIIEQSGPDHAPIFIVQVTVEGHDPRTGKGSNKRESEKSAAENLLSEIKR